MHFFYLQWYSGPCSWSNSRKWGSIRWSILVCWHDLGFWYEILCQPQWILLKNWLSRIHPRRHFLDRASTSELVMKRCWICKHSLGWLDQSIFLPSFLTFVVLCLFKKLQSPGKLKFTRFHWLLKIIEENFFQPRQIDFPGQLSGIVRCPTVRCVLTVTSERSYFLKFAHALQRYQIFLFYTLIFTNYFVTRNFEKIHWNVKF